jgi:CRP-like cAMP-binding protein
MSSTRFDRKLVGDDEAKLVTFSHGGVIFLKGDKGELAYIVKMGQVEIREGGRALETIQEGGLFGEMALIDRGPRSASAVAIGPTQLIAVDRVTFDNAVRRDPEFAVEIMRLMARRLRATVAATGVVDDYLTVDTRSMRSA